MKCQIYSSILEGHQTYEMAGSCDLQKEHKAAADWFSGTCDEGDFEQADELPKYHWFICHIDSMDADLHYDYGADYYFLVREMKSEEGR